ncbi:ABC transporter permease [Rhodococcus sp. IEGM 1366]|uniref:ABC transporter permease n=1 Tax=Rhodococcus sp. IEGM 1366 TaxID=3082223 RepID=UPI0029538B0F|nr:ABC transporter permease [Rhodococcus sp. IEGM 1366]MDV8071307.1 ABC transporter permease [Rhodococcus sp. IEGM 1366]
MSAPSVDTVVSGLGTTSSPDDAATPAPPVDSTDDDKLTPANVALLIGRKLGLLILQVAAAIAVWQAIVSIFSISPQVLPGPLPVWDSLIGLIRSGIVFEAGWVTLQETLLGFVIGAALGIGLAVLLTEVPVLHRLVNPYIVAFQAMPKIAVAPLLLIWFGFGMTSKVVLVVVMVFFPILVNMYTGLNSVGKDQLDLMRAYRASRWDTLRRVRIYAALPFLLASFEVSFVLALTAAVVAEILGSGTVVGLGTLLQMYNARVDMGGMFATVVVLSVMGMLLYASVKMGSRYLLRWNQNPGN